MNKTDQSPLAGLRRAAWWMSVGLAISGLTAVDLVPQVDGLVGWS